MRYSVFNLFILFFSLTPCDLKAQAVDPLFYEGFERHYFSYKSKKIHYLEKNNNQAKGRLVILPGMSEPAIRYTEYTQSLADLPIDIIVIDHLGQGYSDELAPRLHPHQVHIENFRDYTTPVESIIKAANKENNLPTIIQGYSMGGHIATRLLQEQKVPAQAFILMAPMSEPKTFGLPKKLIRFFLGFFSPTSWVPSHGPFQFRSVKKTRFTQSEKRLKVHHALLKKYPEVARGGVTTAWLKAAIDSTEKVLEDGGWDQIHTPTLLLMAGQEHYVLNEPSIAICDKLKNCKHHTITNSYHALHAERDEIYDETIQRVRQFINSELIHNDRL